MSNQPPLYPLQEQTPKFDCNISNPNGKLSDVWLHKEYQSLSLDKQRESRKRIRHPGGEDEYNLYEGGDNGGDNGDGGGIGGGSRNNTVDEKYITRGNDYDREESCDDMLLSDTDCNSQISFQHSFSRENTNVTNTGMIHPPKRRLMSVLSPVTSITPGGEMMDFSSLVGGDTEGGGGSATNNNTNTNTNTNTNSNSTTTNTPPPGSAATPPAASAATPDKTASNTPVSDVEEQTTNLPLPSPSASPIQTSAKPDISDPIERQLSTIPTTQLELINLMTNLSTYLNDRNQNFVIFKLLQNIKRSSLSSLGDSINSSLRRDLVSNLPTEITYNILSQLDYKALYSISQVCSSWYNIINNTDLWIRALKLDHLIIDDDDIQRELSNPQKLIEEWADPHCDILNINVAQLLYKKRRIIYNRWMDPSYQPRRISVPVPGQGNNVVTCLQHDEEKIITGVDDRLINIYSPTTGELLKVLRGHEGGVWALKYTGNTLVSGSTDRTVRIWNISTGKCTHIFRGHTSTVRCLDILHPVSIGKDDTGNDIIFPKVPLLVTGSRDHNLIVWKLPLIPEVDNNEDGIDNNNSESETETYDCNDTENPYLVKVLLGHTQSVRSVSGYGNLIVSGSYDASVRVWDLLDNANCKHVLAGHSDRIYSTVLNFQTRRCYSGSMDSTINIWNIDSGELIHTLEGHASLVGLLELSDEYLVSAAADTTLRVWSPRNGKNFCKLEGHSAAITCFQHDALRIASGSERMLKLWDIKTGKFVRDLLADITGGIWQVRFDFNRCVAAVQRGRNDEEEIFIEILDFSTPPSYKEDHN